MIGVEFRWPKSRSEIERIHRVRKRVAVERAMRSPFLSGAPVADGEVGSLIVTPLWRNNMTPFLRWSSGDLVSLSPQGAGQVTPQLTLLERGTIAREFEANIKAPRFVDR